MVGSPRSPPELAPLTRAVAETEWQLWRATNRSPEGSYKSRQKKSDTTVVDYAPSWAAQRQIVTIVWICKMDGDCRPAESWWS
jgi:hypothetical protein